jgi:hypothetical protein
MDLSRYNKPVNLSGPGNFFNNMSARATSTSQMVLQHGMNMEAAHHGNELAKDLASHQGGIASALSAQGHEQSSALSAQEHGQRLKETAATNRHIIKKTILDHHNDLEKRAVDHHLSTDKLRTESGLRVTEANNTSKNTIKEAGVAHKHAGELIDRISAAGQGGTEVALKHNNVSASFTLKTPPSPATNPTPTVAPRQTKTFVGMPANRASAPAAAPAAPKGPQPTVTRGPGGRMVSLKNPTPTAAPAKKAAAKKAVSAKGQPTVTRDKTTGRMIGIKKK